MSNPYQNAFLAVAALVAVGLTLGLYRAESSEDPPLASTVSSTGAATSPSAPAEPISATDSTGSAPLLLENSTAALAPPSNLVIERGPRGGVMNVPEGHFICQNYDPVAEVCLEKARTEDELIAEEVARNQRLAANEQTTADEFIDCLTRSPLGYPPSPGVSVDVHQILDECVATVSEPRREQYSSDPATMEAVRQIKRRDAAMLAAAILANLQQR